MGADYLDLIDELLINIMSINPDYPEKLEKVIQALPQYCQKENRKRIIALLESRLKRLKKVLTSVSDSPLMIRNKKLCIAYTKKTYDEYLEKYSEIAASLSHNHYKLLDIWGTGKKRKDIELFTDYVSKIFENYNKAAELLDADILQFNSHCQEYEGLLDDYGRSDAYTYNNNVYPPRIAFSLVYSKILLKIYDFSEPEFLSRDSVIALCDAISKDGQFIKKQSIQGLNLLLTTKNLYKTITKARIDQRPSEALRKFKEIYDESKEEIDLRKCNRALIEEFYTESPKNPKIKLGKLFDVSSGNPCFKEFPCPSELKNFKSGDSYTGSSGRQKVLSVTSLYANMEFADIRKAYYEEDNIQYVGGGGTRALWHVFDVLKELADPLPLNALIPVPTYWAYGETVTALEGGYQHVEAMSKTQYLPTPKRILERIGPETTVLVLCTPNNPTGEIYSQEDLIKIVKHIKNINDERRKQGNKRYIYILVDEVFKDLWFRDDQYPNIGEIAKDFSCEEWIIRVRSWSKDRSAGKRLGYIIAHKNFIKKVSRLVNRSEINPPRDDNFIIYDLFARVCNIINNRNLSEHLPESLKETVDYLGDTLNKDKVASIMNDVNINYAKYKLYIDFIWREIAKIPERIALHRPSGGFNMFVMLPWMEFSNRLHVFKFIKALCRDKHMIIYPGEAFGLDSKEHGFGYRLSVSQELKDIQRHGELIDYSRIYMQPPLST